MTHAANQNQNRGQNDRSQDQRMNDRSGQAADRTQSRMDEDKGSEGNQASRNNESSSGQNY
jgi:hypothetical protein